jgi:2-polyprenyl-3-methyl-5-hydroxy-6-metoxy-1,4-benzoquinol methylase
MNQKSPIEFTYEYRDAASSHVWLDEQVLPIIQKLKVTRVLDVGCGNGNLAGQLVEQGFEVVGCDPEESAIEIARRTVPDGHFHVMGVYDNPPCLGEHSFDMVVATEVLEHLFLPRKLVHFAGQTLRPNGWLLITTPFYGSYLKNFLCSLFDKWDDQFTALWDGGHIKFWSLRTLQLLLNEGGFELIEYKLVNRRSRWLARIWPNNIILLARKPEDGFGVRCGGTR